jgi:hypothetical protein
VISHQINDVAFRLDLPQHMHLHLVFHVSLLEPYAITSITNRFVPLPPPIQLAEGPKYEVAAIIDSQVKRKKLYYLVYWVAYTLEVEHGNLLRTLPTLWTPYKNLIVVILINQLLLHALRLVELVVKGGDNVTSTYPKC